MSPRRRAPALYRLMLRLLPRALRTQFGEEMERLFLDRRHEAGDSPLARVSVWAHAVGDLTAHAIAERWHDDRPSSGSPRRRGSFMEHWIADLRYGLRGLRGSPGFAAAAIATLALGIGANVAIFTAINGALLRPLPYPEPDRLVRVWPQMNFNKALAERVVDAAPALREATGMSGWLFTLTGEGEPQQISGVLVSWDHFQVLGVEPALGRAFTRAEGLPGQADAVILSHGLWVNVFGADPGVIGRRIRLAAGEYQSRRIVGVMPADFQAVEPWYRLWAPLDVDSSLSVREDDSWYVNEVIGRLADGATTEQATAQVRALAASLHQEWPERFEQDEERIATVVPLQAHQVRNLSAILWTLLGAVGVVMLIACVNVANLLLARGSRRRADLAMRAALGATRARLVSQMLTEGLVLGFAGCLGGFALALAGLRVLATNAPEEFHRISEATVDPTVMGFALVVSLLAVLLFALLPAWRASAPTPPATSSTRGATRAGRLSKGLVAAEVALSVVLVIGAGLMLRSLWNLYSEDLGFRPQGLLTMRVSIPEGRFEPEALSMHYRRIWEAIDAVPGVERSGGIHLLPLSGGNWSFPYRAEDHPLPEGTPPPSANHRVVTPSYFATMGIPLIRGRGFTAQDTAASEPVGMINERMARELWPDGDPVGKRITVFGRAFTVVGVVGDIHQHGLRQEVLPEMYRPHDQWPVAGMFAVVRTAGTPSLLTGAVRRAIWEVDPDAPLAQVRTMNEVFGQSVASDRFVGLLIASFGVVALLLGAVGVYGVTAYATAMRLREFGVRMAVGADRTTVMRQALGDGVRPALLGVVLGIGGAWSTTRLLAARLYGVTAYDPTTFVAVPVILIIVAAVACLLPAWRASRLDPLGVLRDE